MTVTLDRAEAIAILEDIARNGQNAAARIAAIKQLEDFRDEATETPQGFEGLYAVENGA